jgi:membrane protein DedA with SNARE-associated domain
MSDFWAAASVFAAIILGAIGLPFPEEVVIPAGALAAFPSYERLLAVAIGGYLGILVADNLLFGFGHFFGSRLLSNRFVSRALPPERLAMIQGWLERRGALAIAVVRFIPGLRMAGFFTAGSLGYPWRRFLLIDSSMAIISVTVLCLIGFHLGDVLPGFLEKVKGQPYWFLLLLLPIVIFLGLRARRRQKHATPSVDELLP